MRITLMVVVLALGFLSTPWLGGDRALLAQEPDLLGMPASSTKLSSSIDLMNKAKDLLTYTRAGKLIDLGKVTVQFVLYGTKWSNTNISASFMPDGALFDGQASGLFSLLDQQAPRDVWQREYAKALARLGGVHSRQFPLGRRQRCRTQCRGRDPS